MTSTERMHAVQAATRTFKAALSAAAPESPERATALLRADWAAVWARASIARES